MGRRGGAGPCAWEQPADDGAGGALLRCGRACEPLRPSHAARPRDRPGRAPPRRGRGPTVQEAPAAGRCGTQPRRRTGPRSTRPRDLRVGPSSQQSRGDRGREEGLARTNGSPTSLRAVRPRSVPYNESSRAALTSSALIWYPLANSAVARTRQAWRRAPAARVGARAVATDDDGPALARERSMGVRDDRRQPHGEVEPRTRYGRGYSSCNMVRMRIRARFRRNGCSDAGMCAHRSFRGLAQGKPDPPRLLPLPRDARLMTGAKIYVVRAPVLGSTTSQA